MPTITATDAKKAFFDLMDRVSRNSEIIRISSEEGGAVLMPEEKFESLQDTLVLLSASSNRSFTVPPTRCGRTIRLRKRPPRGRRRKT